LKEFLRCALLSSVTGGICRAYTGCYHRASGDTEGRPGAASSQPSAVTAHPGHKRWNEQASGRSVKVLGKTLELEHGGGTGLQQAGRHEGV